MDPSQAVGDAVHACEQLKFTGNSITGRGLQRELELLYFSSILSNKSSTFSGFLTI